jgi:hypothetical protein
MKTFLERSFRFCMVCSMLVMLSEFLLLGQDVIVKKNGEEIKAKVEEVQNYDVKYHRFDNLTGPLYTISKAELASIKYENGMVDSFANIPAPVTKPSAYTPPVVREKDLRRARTGMVLDYVIYAPVAASIVVGIVAGTSSGDDGRYMMAYTLIPNLAITTVFIPISASQGSWPRKYTGVEGNTGLRTAGWIIYGTYMAGGLATGFLTGGNVVENPLPLYLSVLVLDAAAATCFALDNGKTYKQMKELQNSAYIQPTINILNDRMGHNYMAVGIRVNF